MYGSARKSYSQMLDPVHIQCLMPCLKAFRTSLVESLYVDFVLGTQPYWHQGQ